MKKRKHGFLAIMLVVSILVGTVSVYVNAGNSSATDSQNIAPKMENELNVISKTDYSSGTINFVGSGDTVSNRAKLIRQTIVDNIKGDTWAFSTTFNLSKCSTWYGPGIMIADGTYKGTAQTRLRFDIEKSGESTSRYVLRGMSVTDSKGEDKDVISYGDIGSALELNKDYQLTMKVSEREVLQCWLNDTLIATVSLKDKGITNVTPSFGWSCWGTIGTFKELQLWEPLQDDNPDNPDVPENPDIPNIEDNLNVITKTQYPSGVIAFDTNDDNTKWKTIRGVIQENIKGDTWALSTTFNLSRQATWYAAPGVMIAEGTYNGNAQTRIRFDIEKSGEGTSRYTFRVASGSNATKEQGTIIGYGNLPTAVTTGKDYRLVMKLSDKDILQCWLDGTLVASISLKDQGITNITPVFGWYCNYAIGTFKKVQLWEVADEESGNEEIIPVADDLTFDNGKKVSFGQGISSSGAETYVIGGYALEGEDAELSKISADVKFSKKALYKGVGLRFGTMTDNAGEKHVLYFVLQQTNYDTGLRWGLYVDGRADTNMLTYGSYNKTFNLEHTYTLKMSFDDQILSVTVNENVVLQKNITQIKEANKYVELVIDKTELVCDTAASISNVKLSGTGVKERLNLNTMTNGTVTIACDNGDLSKGAKVIVIPQAEENYNLVAGGLKYTMGEEAHCINNLDEQTGGHVFTMPEENITLHCEFSEDSKQNISIAVIGASLERVDENSDEYKGIRFLIRMGLPDTTKSPIGQKVVYEGKEYTIKDYGTLSAKVSDYDTKGDDAFKKVSRADICDTTQDFADYMVAYRTVSDLNEEYIVKGYVELEPTGLRKTVILETEPYNESIASTKAKLK